MGKLSLIKKILILVLILALPGFLYYLLTAKGKNRYHPLAKFGPKEIAKTTHRVRGKDVPDTIYHVLNDFTLTDQDGKPVSLKTFDEKIFVADFFYTHCPNICTTMNANMDSLSRAWVKNKMVYFASITVDPDRDTAPVLKEYSKKFPGSAKWFFLTGDTSTTYPLARKGFLVNALKVDKDSFIYSDKLMLIDSHKRIRGYYSGASTADVIRLNDEIKVLLSEELMEKDKPLY